MRHWTGLGAPDRGRGREGEDRQTEILRMRAWGDPRFHLLPPHWPFASEIQKQFCGCSPRRPHHVEAGAHLAGVQGDSEEPPTHAAAQLGTGRAPAHTGFACCVFGIPHLTQTPLIVKSPQHPSMSSGAVLGSDSKPLWKYLPRHDYAE